MSSTNTQFAVAVHLLAGLGTSPRFESTSGRLAESVNTSPSFVRRILSKLAKAGLVRTTAGKSGSTALSRKPEKINLLEVFEAVGGPQPFAIHEHPVQPTCRVSCGIKSSLGSVFHNLKRAMEENLRQTHLSTVISGLEKR